jgi:hypothetical protein
LLLRCLIGLLFALVLAAFLAQGGRVLAAGPGGGDGSDNSVASEAFVRDATVADTSIGDAQLATFFVATGNGTYVCILHPEWGTLTSPAPP